MSDHLQLGLLKLLALRQYALHRNRWHLQQLRELNIQLRELLYLKLKSNKLRALILPTHYFRKQKQLVISKSRLNSLIREELPDWKLHPQKK